MIQEENKKEEQHNSTQQSSETAVNKNSMSVGYNDSRSDNGYGYAGKENNNKKYPSWTDIFALLGVFIVSSVLAAMVISILDKTGSSSYGFSVFIAYIIQFLIVIIFAVIQKRRRAPYDKPVLKFTFKKVNPAVTLWGLIMVLATSIVVEPVVNFFPDTYLDSLSHIMGAGGWMMITMLVMAPIMEEILFRGIIQDALTAKYGPFRGIIIASAVFGIVHINPPQAINAFFVALMLGYVYYLTQSLVPVIFIHAVNNAISYFSWILNDQKIVPTSEMVSNQTLYYILYAIACVVVIIAFVSIYRTIKKDTKSL